MAELKHEAYKVDTDFEGGYVIKAKLSDARYDYVTVARYDSEHGESFSSEVTDSQKEEIREFARRAWIL